MSVRFSNQNYKLLSIIILLLLGLIVYSNTFFNSFHFDDESSIINNYAIRNIRNLRNIWNFWPSRFITILTFALNYHFSKLNVFPYHVFNIASHLGSAILVFWLALLILSTPIMKKSAISKYTDSMALFVALIFISHPIQTQAVNYIWQRSTSLVGFFYLFSLCLYIKARLLQIDNNKASKWLIFYVSSYVFCILSMFTKENAVTLPLIIILCEFSFFNIERHANWKYALYFLFTLLIVPILLFTTRSGNSMCIQRLIDDPIDKGGVYLLTQFRVIVTYIRLLFVPLNQNLDYDYPVAKNLMDITTLGSLFILVIIIMGAIRTFPRYRLLSFCIFYFFITLLPESSIMPLEDVIFEHRLYLPMVGYSLFTVSSIYYLFEKKAQKPIVIVLLMIVTSYSILTYLRNSVWKDELTLWNDVIRKSPRKARPYNNRGYTYQENGSLDKALLDYNKAIEFNPNYALAYSNRGNVYRDQGSLDKALLDYNKAIELNPNYALPAYSNRGLLYHDQGNLDKAILDYNKAIEINPKSALAYHNRGCAYQDKGSLDKALLDYNKAIEFNPNYALAYSNRGNVYRDQGSLDKALLDYNKAIELDPKHALAAYNNRGLLRQDQGNFDAALLDFNKAIEIEPSRALVYYNRGNVYRDQGNIKQALLDYSKAIELDPSDAEFYNNRGIAYYLNKEYDKSLRDMLQAKALGHKVNPALLEELKKILGVK